MRSHLQTNSIDLSVHILNSAVLKEPLVVKDPYHEWIDVVW